MAVLICYPIGDEYMRSHSTCVLLASQLATHGFPTLRFDYYGTGDSEGSLDDVCLAMWLDDIAAAASFLRTETGLGDLCLIGIRLGATLAALASARVEAAQLVLWEAVVDGTSHLDEQVRLHEAWETGSFAKRGASPAGDAGLELGGYRLSEALVTDMRGLNLVPTLERTSARMLLVHGESGGTTAAVARRLAKVGEAPGELHIPDCVPWSKRRDVDKGLGSLRAIRRITAWIGGKDP